MCQYDIWKEVCMWPEDNFHDCEYFLLLLQFETVKIGNFLY